MWYERDSGYKGVEVADMKNDSASASTPLTGEPMDPLDHAIKYQGAEHNHYAAIGRVAAAWSYLEATIDSGSIRLADIDPRTGICLTAQIAGTGRKLDAYISLARLRGIPPALIKQLNAFANDTNGLGERRNRSVHDVWLFKHPDSPERLEATARKLLRFQYIPTSTEDLLGLGREIYYLTRRFGALSEAVEAFPLSETPPSAPLP
jgi:hypothetical protein